MKMSKSILTLAVILGVSSVLPSCSNSQNSETTSTTVDTNMGVEQISAITDGYLDIKDALVATDGAAASNAAKQLLKHVDDGQDDLLQKIRIDVEHIAESIDTEHQREHFNTLSENIYTLVKAIGANESKLYRQYCPMAFENEGAYWISAEKEINNPYFGDKMLHCGSVKEEL
ncbi:MAG: hypothetical protein ACI83L_002524 [Cryomorphaceae bacterium]|jgi:hypothetical protein